MYNQAIARTNMVLGQIEPNTSLSQPLRDALMEIPRHNFVPKHLQGVAYVDKQLAVGHGRYLMSPMQFSIMVQLAAVGPQDTVLDIGCTTGYSAAVFSRLAKKVIALEPDAELASKANHSLNGLGIANSIIISGNRAEGHPEAAPYDVIFINGAVQKVPERLLAQLADKGRLIAVVYRQSDYNSLSQTALGEVVLFQRDKDLVSQRSIMPATLFPLVAFVDLV